MAFHSYPQLIQKLFNAYWCGPPTGVTRPSPWSRVDHLVSRLSPLTKRPIQTRFPFGCVLNNTYPCQRRYLVGSLCKRHAVTAYCCSDRLYATGFRNSFTPLRGVLFTFPSRYLCTIGLSGVFSLTGWSRLIHAEFLVIRVTQDTAGMTKASSTGLSPSMAELSNSLLLTFASP